MDMLKSNINAFYQKQANMVKDAQIADAALREKAQQKEYFREL